MNRPERFSMNSVKDSNFPHRLEAFTGLVITHIFMKYKESPEEIKRANAALSHFIKVSQGHVSEVKVKARYTILLLR